MTLSPSEGRFVVDETTVDGRMAASAPLSIEAQAVLYEIADRLSLSPSVLAARLLALVLQDRGLTEALLESV